ncbi:MAG: tRNA dihydrouridine synthase DusB [Clostridia bacterium]|nr:tRNA dihydrouridine synthase DusB [Clostridia bacterium]
MTNFNPKEYFKKNNLVLAPMAGYTDIGFRHLCRSYGAGLVFTEMISAKAILYNNEKTLQLMASTEDEHPIALQLFGNCPEDFEQVLKRPEIRHFDVIDINMGCPAPKIVKNGEGSALLENIDLARQIIRTTVQNTHKPVSVKFRSGVDDEHIIAVEFAKMCEEEGVAFITFHPRTRAQGYAGHSDWEQIKQVVDAVNIPVIASGDVLTYLDLQYLINNCGASAVMVGRGAVGNPEIFYELKNNRKTKLTLKDKIAQIEVHIKWLRQNFSENYVSSEMKKHILSYVKSFDGAVEMKKRVAIVKNIDECIKILKEYAN